MAARALLRRKFVPLLVGSLVMMPSVAFAKAPPSPDPESSHHSKKPIYDELPPLPSTVPTAPPQQSTNMSSSSSSFPPSPSASWSPFSNSDDDTVTGITATQTRSRRPSPTDRLAGQIRVARLWLHSRATSTEDAVDGALTRAFALEHSFTETVASLAPPRSSGERLMPGAIYVLVAAMAGSVVARNRNVVLRASTPLILGIVAAKTFIPITTRNIGDLVWEWEKNVPAVADAHMAVTDGMDKGIHFTKVHADLGKHWVETKVGSARESVEGWVKKGK